MITTISETVNTKQAGKFSNHNNFGYMHITKGYNTTLKGEYKLKD